MLMIAAATSWPQARRALTEAGGGIDRLLQMVEQGLMGIDDPARKERLESTKLARVAAADGVHLLDRNESADTGVIISDKIQRPAVALRAALQTGDIVFRKAYLRLFVDQVVVGDDEIRLRGPKTAFGEGRFGRTPPSYPGSGAQFCSGVASRAGFEPALPP